MDRTLTSFRLYLISRNRAPRTIDSYVGAAERFMAVHPNISSVTRRDVQDYIGSLVERSSAGNAAVQYRSLQQFFKWHAMELSTLNPMEGMKPPHVPEVTVPVIDEMSLKKLLAVTAGKAVSSRRDHAILRLLIDTGVRLSELTDIQIEDIDLGLRTVMVMGKGRRPRPVAFGAKTALAIDRYMRTRKETAGPLWLGTKGALTGSGITQMIKRRCGQAGIPAVHPHQFRHTFAHRWLDQGGNEGDLLMLAGWRSRTMLQRYGRSSATDRALAAARKMDIGGRL